MRRAALLPALLLPTGWLFGCSAPLEEKDTTDSGIWDAAFADAGALMGGDAGMDAGADLPDAGDRLADAGNQTAACPPSGPFGTQEGQLLQDVALSDCDGNVHHLNDLCQRQASWIYLFAGW